MMKFFLFVLVFTINKFAKGDYQFLSTNSGEVKEGNFNYYSMNFDGTILLELVSTLGDSDLYISEKTVKPTFDPHNNCLQSVTCGIDSVIVPKRFKRPVGVGIFGHPSHEVSHYVLNIFRVNDHYDFLNYNSYNATEENYFSKKLKVPEIETKMSEDNESYLNIILKYVIECLIEVFIM